MDVFSDSPVNDAALAVASSSSSQKGSNLVVDSDVGSLATTVCSSATNDDNGDIKSVKSASLIEVSSSGALLWKCIPPKLETATIPPPPLHHPPSPPPSPPNQSPTSKKVTFTTPEVTFTTPEAAERKVDEGGSDLSESLDHRESKKSRRTKKRHRHHSEDKEGGGEGGAEVRSKPKKRRTREGGSHEAMPNRKQEGNGEAGCSHGMKP